MYAYTWKTKNRWTNANERHFIHRAGADSYMTPIHTTYAHSVPHRPVSFSNDHRFPVFGATRGEVREHRLLESEFASVVLCASCTGMLLKPVCVGFVERIWMMCKAALHGHDIFHTQHASAMGRNFSKTDYTKLASRSSFCGLEFIELRLQGTLMAVYLSTLIMSLPRKLSESETYWRIYIINIAPAHACSQVNQPSRGMKCQGCGITCHIDCARHLDSQCGSVGSVRVQSRYIVCTPPGFGAEAGGSTWCSRLWTRLLCVTACSIKCGIKIKAIFGMLGGEYVI